jgi:hypothetical protein
MQTAEQMRPATPVYVSPMRTAHGKRCRQLPPVRPGEAERLVSEFLSHHRVTVCPTRYAVAIEQPSQLTKRGF